jgi:hypothetical protein
MGQCSQRLSQRYYEWLSTGLRAAMTLDFDGVVLLEAAETASVTLTLGEMTGDVAEAETETAADAGLNVSARADNFKTAPIIVKSCDWPRVLVHSREATSSICRIHCHQRLGRSGRLTRIQR